MARVALACLINQTREAMSVYGYGHMMVILLHPMKKGVPLDRICLYSDHLFSNTNF